jgi:glycosyltransferase involved in cell wall biosynthesis
MHIGIDVTPLLAVETGVDRYLIKLVHGLAAVDDATRYTVFVNRGDAHRFAGLGRNFSLLPAGMRGRAGRFVVQQLMVPVLARSRQIDILHSPSFFIPYWRGGVRHVVSVHDMTVISRASCHTRFRRSRFFQRGIATAIRRSDRVLVPSEFVRQEVLRLLPEVRPQKIRVTPYGVDPEFQPAASGSAPLPPALAALGPYILFVGTIEPRKNLPLLLEAYRDACARHGLREHLLLVGRKGWNYSQVERLMQLPELRHRVHLAGYVERRDLVHLYQNASAFVYPSLEEGFGFPPLEAMACGIPTITADSSSLKENLSGAALLVPPDSVPALADALAAALKDGETRSRLIEQGLARARQFPWARTAQKTLGCYRELAG